MQNITSLHAQIEVVFSAFLILNDLKQVLMTIQTLHKILITGYYDMQDNKIIQIFDS